MKTGRRIRKEEVQQRDPRNLASYFYLAEHLHEVPVHIKYLYRIIFIFFGSERDEGVASAYFPEEKI